MAPVFAAQIAETLGAVHATLENREIQAKARMEADGPDGPAKIVLLEVGPADQEKVLATHEVAGVDFDSENILMVYKDGGMPLVDYAEMILELNELGLDWRKEMGVTA